MVFKISVAPQDNLYDLFGSPTTSFSCPGLAGYRYIVSNPVIKHPGVFCLLLLWYYNLQVLGQGAVKLFVVHIWYFLGHISHPSFQLFGIKIPQLWLQVYLALQAIGRVFNSANSCNNRWLNFVFYFNLSGTAYYSIVVKYGNSHFLDREEVPWICSTASPSQHGNNHMAHYPLKG